jgi:hypothetical protein
LRLRLAFALRLLIRELSPSLVNLLLLLLLLRLKCGEFLSLTLQFLLSRRFSVLPGLLFRP